MGTSRHYDTTSDALQRTIRRSPTLSYAVQYPHRTAQLTSHTHRQSMAGLRLPCLGGFISAHVRRSPTLSPTLSNALSHTLQRSVRLSRAALSATRYAASIARPPHKSRDARFAAATLLAHRTAQLASHTQFSAHVHHTIHARLRSPISPPHSSAHVPHTNLSSRPSHNPRFQLRIIRTSLSSDVLGSSK